jgi:hypothetical protein
MAIEPDSIYSHERAWWWPASLIALGVAMALFRLVPTEADPDLWGHLRFGLDLLDTGRIVRPDPYSYLTGRQLWINHEWLAEAVTALAWRGGGALAVVALKVALALAVAAIVCRHLVERGVRLLPSLLLTAYGVAVILPGWRSLRPQAFTYLAFAILLVLIHRASRGRARAMWFVPPMLAVWANLHGGFVAGLGLLMLWGVTEAIERRVDAQRRADARPHARPSSVTAIWLIVAASVAATLLTPYGWTLWAFLLRTLGPRPEIVEWQPVPLVTAQGAAYAAVVIVGSLGLAGSRKPRRLIDVVLFASGAVLPWIAQRHLPLCVLITLVFCGEHIESAASAWADRLARVRRRRDGGPVSERRTYSDRFRPLVAGALAVEAAILLWLTIAAPHAGRIVYDGDQYPVAATALLADSGVTANLAVFFDWGEYVLWHAGPRVKVSVDGRRETVYSDLVYRENMAFTDGAGQDASRDDPGGAWDRLLTRRPTDLALVSNITPAYHLLLAHPGWELLVQDGSAALFGGRGTAVTSQLRATSRAPRPERRMLIFP